MAALTEIRNIRGLVVREKGHVRDIRSLAGSDVERLDRVARRFFTFDKLIAALERTGCGPGGLGLTAADIQPLPTGKFRAAQQVGSSYGFDMREPAMFPIILGVFSSGSCPEAAAKGMAIAHVRAAAGALPGVGVGRHNDSLCH